MVADVAHPDSVNDSSAKAMSSSRRSGRSRSTGRSPSTRRSVQEPTTSTRRVSRRSSGRSSPKPGRWPKARGHASHVHSASTGCRGTLQGRSLPTKAGSDARRLDIGYRSVDSIRRRPISSPAHWAAATSAPRSKARWSGHKHRYPGEHPRSERRPPACPAARAPGRSSRLAAMQGRSRVDGAARWGTSVGG